jgi:hypothetical protein
MVQAISVMLRYMLPSEALTAGCGLGRSLEQGGRYSRGKPDNNLQIYKNQVSLKPLDNI